MPTSAGGTVLERALTVLTASSRRLFSFLLGCSDPQVTMLGFKRHPYSNTFQSARALNTALNTSSVILWETSAECGPSDKISGSTMGTNPFCWQIKAYLARPTAFSLMASSEGHPSPIFKTARHLANLQPRAQNSAAMAGRASIPLVKFSSLPLSRMPSPLSTLMPATMPRLFTQSVKLSPSLPEDCLAVSSWKMTPEMYCSIPGEVSSMWRYLLLFSALFSNPIPLNFFSTEPGDSSAARMPFPGVQILWAVSISSLEQSFFPYINTINISLVVQFTSHINQIHQSLRYSTIAHSQMRRSLTPKGSARRLLLLLLQPPSLHEQ